MLVDLTATRQLHVHADATVVVGSGAAGLALAGRLAARGVTVVLLESGPDVPDPADHAQARAAAAGTEDLNEGVVVGLPFLLAEGRARGYGGTTALWHGQCMRLHPLDLRPRPWVARSGWPFGLDVLAPWYRLAEEWFDVPAEGSVAAQWASRTRVAPLPWNPERLLHDSTVYAVVARVGRRHRRALRASRTVSVVVNATVARVLVEHGRAVGVELVAPGGRRETVRCRQVVLAAGGVENARILQLSDQAGVGLGTGRDNTGRYLQTHPIVLTAAIRAQDPSVVTDRYVAVRLGRHRYFPKVRLAPAAQEREGLLNANAVFLPEYTDPGFTASRRLLAAVRRRDRAVVSARDLRGTLRSTGPLVRDGYRHLVHGMATAQQPASVRLEVWLEQVPDPESRLTLGHDRDGLGLRRAVASWRVDDAELRTSRTLTRWVGEDLARLGVATLQELAPMHDDDAWRQGVRDAAHPTGTTRMSTDPTTGVVDADLAVHGVPGLWVVGSSVFPSAGYANPTLTIVALSLRLAEHLASRDRVG